MMYFSGARDGWRQDFLKKGMIGIDGLKLFEESIVILVADLGFADFPVTPIVIFNCRNKFGFRI
jgi:hypothetical protein